MPRAVVTQRTTVPSSERKRVLERMRSKRSYYQGASCRYWVFEETDLPGAFIEFIEAEDAETLNAALQGAPKNAFADPWRIYEEIPID